MPRLTFIADVDARLAEAIRKTGRTTFDLATIEDAAGNSIADYLATTLVHTPTEDKETNMLDATITERADALEARELAETSPEALQEFDDALTRFKEATAGLAAAWEDVPGWIVGDSYPSWPITMRAEQIKEQDGVVDLEVHLPSFEEFAFMVQDIELKRLPEPIELPRHDVPAVGARVIAYQPYGWPDPMFANVQQDELGTVGLVDEDCIWVTMDRYYPGLREWDNQLQCSATDVSNRDPRLMDQLTPAEAAAVIFHENFKVIR